MSRPPMKREASEEEELLFMNEGRTQRTPNKGNAADNPEVIDEDVDKVHLRHLDEWPVEGTEDERLIEIYASRCSQLSDDVGAGGVLSVRLKEFANLVLLENSLQYLYDRDKEEWAKPLKQAVDIIQKRHEHIKAFAQTLNHQRDRTDFRNSIVLRAKAREQRATEAEVTLKAIRADTNEVLGRRR